MQMQHGHACNNMVERLPGEQAWIIARMIQWPVIHGCFLVRVASAILLQYDGIEAQGLS